MVISRQTRLHCRRSDGCNALHGCHYRRLDCGPNNCREVYNGPSPDTQAKTATAADTWARDSSPTGAVGSTSTTSSSRENPAEALAVSRLSLSPSSYAVSWGYTPTVVDSLANVFVL